ncbi:hypothetical protein KBC97_00215 [Candidatus Gracilibacteria bacterium]|nr:hypothetical protein [Candidatus Gracilibacteria bacterium]
MAEIQTPKLELGPIKSDLETIILDEISDEESLVRATEILDTIIDDNSLFTALENLQKFLSLNSLQTLYTKIANTYLGEGIPENSLKRIFATAAIQHETRDQIFDWLRSLEEQDVEEGIVAISAAIENALDSDIPEKEILTEIFPEIGEITEEFRALAQEIIVTRIINPDSLKVKNLLRVSRPKQTKLSRALLKRFQAEIAEQKKSAS